MNAKTFKPYLSADNESDMFKLEFVGEMELG